MLNILFYAPFSNRSRDAESVMLECRRQGHNVIFISSYESGAIHDFLRSRGIPVHVHSVTKYNRIAGIISQIFFLIRFCRRHNIQLLFSHLESANFISVCAGFFIRAQVIINRHHADDFILNNWSNSWTYRFTNKMVKKCIVYSQVAKRVMIEQEGMNSSQLIVMPLLYDFELYNKVNHQVVQQLKAKFPNELILTCIGRLVEMKKIPRAIYVLENLIRNGIHARLFVLGEGYLMSDLKTLVNQLGLSDQVVFLGRVENVLDYLTFADIVLHPSVSESSCVVIKEAGLTKTIPIVCDQVGDFNEYLVNNESAILVSRDNFVEGAVEFISLYLKDIGKYRHIGENLNQIILKKFSIENNFQLYDKYLNNRNEI